MFYFIVMAFGSRAQPVFEQLGKYRPPVGKQIRILIEGVWFNSELVAPRLGAWWAPTLKPGPGAAKQRSGFWPRNRQHPDDGGEEGKLP